MQRGSAAKATTPLALALLWLLASPLLAAHAQEPTRRGEADVDTQFIFGFTSGADVGEAGERELEQQSIAQWGKRTGSYAALDGQLRYETSPVQNFRFEIGVPLAIHDVAGVSGLDDRRAAAFKGLVAEFGYRLLDRAHAPFALTLRAEPHWSRVDDTSGAPVDGYGSDFSLAIDRELSPGRVFGALNLVYAPELIHARTSGTWQRDATLGLSASVTRRIAPGFFVGAEAQYLRKYDALGLDAFAGEAMFLGPTFFVRVAKGLAVSGAWAVQTAGHAAGVPGTLDLANFTRHQATLRVEYNF